MANPIYNQISQRIIEEQALIIGPIAWDEATKVSGLRIIDKLRGEISLEGDSKEVLNKLVAQYERLFGQASVETCKGAVQDLIVELPADQVPSSLR